MPSRTGRPATAPLVHEDGSQLAKVHVRERGPGPSGQFVIRTSPPGSTPRDRLGAAGTAGQGPRGRRFDRQARTRPSGRRATGLVAFMAWAVMAIMGTCTPVSVSRRIAASSPSSRASGRPQAPRRMGRRPGHRVWRPGLTTVGDHDVCPCFSAAGRQLLVHQVVLGRIQAGGEPADALGGRTRRARARRGRTSPTTGSLDRRSGRRRT